MSRSQKLSDEERQERKKASMSKYQKKTRTSVSPYLNGYLTHENQVENRDLYYQGRTFRLLLPSTNLAGRTQKILNSGYPF